MFNQWLRSMDKSPEERLWAAVMLVFFHDIQNDVNRYHELLNGKRGEQWKKVEKHLYHARHPWAGEICNMLGISHERFLEVVGEIINREKEIEARVWIES